MRRDYSLLSPSLAASFRALDVQHDLYKLNDDALWSEFGLSPTDDPRELRDTLAFYVAVKRGLQSHRGFRLAGVAKNVVEHWLSPEPESPRAEPPATLLAEPSAQSLSSLHRELDALLRPKSKQIDLNGRD